MTKSRPTLFVFCLFVFFFLLTSIPARTASVLDTQTSAFPGTVITSKNSTSTYATTLNAFWVSDHALAGQCTWYAYGRVIELSEGGSLAASAATIMHDAFWGESGRDAKNWPSFLGGEWTSTNSIPLPIEKRNPGMLAVWPYGTHGHVGFVEEISADKTQYRLSDFNRGDDEIYRSVWYQFEGTSDFLLGGYPSFYQLPLGTSSPYQGYHDGVDCNNIYGWAWNSTQPGSTVNVNIYYDGNNLLAANVPANQFRSDLPGGGFHAFNYPTPAFLKNGQSHSIRVQFSINNQDLNNTPKSFTFNCGGCTGTKATMQSPANGSTFGSSSVTFTWNSGSSATQYWLYVGSSPGSEDIYSSNQGTGLSANVSNIPTDGRNIYVTLWSFICGAWQSNPYSYHAATGCTGTKATMQSPANGSTFGSSSVTFTWNSGSSATQYWLYVGSSPGAERPVQRQSRHQSVG